MEPKIQPDREAELRSLSLKQLFALVKFDEVERKLTADELRLIRAMVVAEVNELLLEIRSRIS